MVSGDEEQPQKFGQVFRRFSEETYIGSSPLYASLSDGIAEDLDVLDIASSARGRPVPNLLFAAVHYLLLRGAVDTLSSFYASLTRDPRPIATPIRTSANSAWPTSPPSGTSYQLVWFRPTR